MTRDRGRFATGTTIAIAAVIAVGGVLAVKALAPEKELARGYGRALTDVADAWRSGAGSAALDPRHVVLSKATGPAVPVIGHVSVGDTVTIGSSNGVPQRIVVTAVERLALEDGPGLTFQIVTGRREGPNAGLVRFIFAGAPTEVAPAVPKSDKVL
ncbi:MAG: hypothetical protein R3D68_06235 [Hyphomicrobiaceae bacterium]